MSLSLDIEIRKVEESGTYKLFDISSAYTAEETTAVTVNIVDGTPYSFLGGEYLTVLYSIDDFTLTKTVSGGITDTFETKLLILDGDNSTDTFTASTSASEEITLYMFKS